MGDFFFTCRGNCEMTDEGTGVGQKDTPVSSFYIKPKKKKKPTQGKAKLTNPYRLEAERKRVSEGKYLSGFCNHQTIDIAQIIW